MEPLLYDRDAYLPLGHIAPMNRSGGGIDRVDGVVVGRLSALREGHGVDARVALDR